MPTVCDEPPKECPVGPGYWWLAYSWDNYVLACKPCNQGWKRNLFLTDRSQCSEWGEGTEQGEAASLLHPYERFRTRDHFRWTREAYMYGVSARGRDTIITCGLNRQALQIERHDELRKLLTMLQQMRIECQDCEDSAPARWGELLKQCGDPRESFASMVRWFIEEELQRPWEDCFDEQGLVILDGAETSPGARRRREHPDC